MKTKYAAAAALAALAAAAAVPAHAARGYTVTQDEESLVHVGMTADEVRQTLGRPKRNMKFGNLPGPTWTYDLNGTTEHAEVLDVDFGADGRVASVEERLTESGGRGRR